MVEMELMEETFTAMNKALEFATSNNGRPSLDESIEESLLQLMKEEAKRIKSNIDDITRSKEENTELCECIVESMKNHMHMVDGKPGLYPFSPKTTCMAMCQLIRSGNHHMRN